METLAKNRTEEVFVTVIDWGDKVFALVLIILGWGVTSLIGMITSIINIIVFVKQGAYKENATINLLGLSIADFIMVFNIFCESVCFSILYIDPPGIAWDMFDMMYLISLTHMMGTQMLRTITAFVAFERCFCVVFPFRVRDVFTAKRSAIVMLTIFMGIGFGFIPMFITIKLEYKLDPVTNTSKVTIIKDLEWLYVMDIVWAVTSVLFNQGPATVVLLCTIITVSRVKLSKTWRESMTPSSKTSNQEGVQSKQIRLSSKMQKEKKLITMITSMSTVFLVCYVPDFVYMFIYAIEPETYSTGKNYFLTFVMYYVTFSMETINSAVNIVFYYRMSSKYRHIFRQMMGLTIEKH